MNVQRIVAILFLFGFASNIMGQPFTLADTLRGTIGPHRGWWDIKKYDLTIAVDIENQSLSGINEFNILARAPGQIMQIDLQEHMHIDKVTWKGRTCSFTKNGAAHFVDLGQEIKEGHKACVKVEFSGRPRVAQNPPWDGALTWTKDQKGRPFIATSCQGDGASLWWPCKDHPADEPNEMTMTFTVPDGLTAVGNGRLIKSSSKDGRSSFTWKVKQPINHYGVNMNIGAYTLWNEAYDGLNGELDCTYYVLDYELERSKEQFKDAKRMLDAFEYWFGPYPFYEDGFKLVEVPYLGMEHQSSVTYGNKYLNGYLGRDLSQTGHGLLFDFIIIHESAHEWWANAVTAADNADMWIHESFTHYAESLFLEYHYGKEQAFQYLRGVRSGIRNDRPIQGPYGVNRSGSGDMYSKGANIIHMLRMWIDNDDTWRILLKNIQREFSYTTIDADKLMRFIEQETGLNLEGFFRQWFQDERVPILQYRVFPGGLQYKWSHCVREFDMPVDIWVDGEKIRLHPNLHWQSLDRVNIRNVTVDVNYYVGQLYLD